VIKTYKPLWKHHEQILDVHPTHRLRGLSPVFWCDIPDVTGLQWAALPRSATQPQSVSVTCCVRLWFLEGEPASDFSPLEDSNFLQQRAPLSFFMFLKMCKSRMYYLIVTDALGPEHLHHPPALYKWLWIVEYIWIHSKSNQVKS